MVPTREILTRYKGSRSPRLRAFLQVVTTSENLLATVAAADALWDETPPDDTQELKHELLDVLLFFIEQCLDDHSLSDDEQIALDHLKRLFRVREGDFYTLRRDAIADMFRGEISRILEDGKVDRLEALHQVSLQRAFDLSYD
jgi:hypothetical protein